MIRILHVVTYMGRGGLETMLMNYYRALDRSRFQFDFLTHRIEKHEYDDEILSLGGKIYHISRLNPFSVSYKKELLEFLKKHPEYKIIHVHQDCLSSVILKRAKQCNIPVRIAHSHSSSQNKNIKYIIKLWYKKFIPKYATQLLACGKEAGDWMFEGQSYQVLNNAIDAKKYKYDLKIREKMRQQLQISGDTKVIGHVGRFSEPKNHSFLIDIFQCIHEENKNTKLLLVGDGELYNQIQEKVKKYGLEEAVIFTGVRADVTDLMQTMDVFLFPSLYEGLPLTLIEAQAAGLPCIISDKVPIECAITNLVQQVSLNSDKKKWASVVLETTCERKEMYLEICEAGFDIRKNVRKLQKMYVHWLESNV